MGTVVSVQPVPKAAYRSDFRENTNFCPQRNSNLGPLAQQASMLPLDHCDLSRNDTGHLLSTTKEPEKETVEKMSLRTIAGNS